MPREATLARTFVELTDTLVADFDVVETLTLLTDRCVEVFDVGAAGLMLRAPEGDLRVMASSSEAMRLLELFELQSEEGPCLDCYRSGAAVVSTDLADDVERWPQFATRALDAGFRSLNALPMRLRSNVLGAVNLFHIESGALRQADLRAAQALTDVATIAVLQHRVSSEAQVLNEQLSEALNTRIVIEQAKGMIAEREGLPMDQAFALLRNHARSTNLRLADVAQAVASGTLALSPLARPPGEA